MSPEEIMKLRPGDPLVADDLDPLYDLDGVPISVNPTRTQGRWAEAGINRMRGRIGAALLDDEDD